MRRKSIGNTAGGGNATRQEAAGERLLTLTQARANKLTVDWTGYRPPVPQSPGVHRFDDYPLSELVDYIDWMPFFNAWEFHGRFPRILDDPTVGEACRTLYEDALGLLTPPDRTGNGCVRRPWRDFSRPTPGATISRSMRTSPGRQVLARLHHLRQQRRKRADLHNDCLADFVAQRDTGVADYLGAFAVTAGIGLDECVARFEADHDDYSAIILKALADRLAEAFAERLHQIVRTELVGICSSEERLGQRGAHRRRLPRDPARTRIPGMSGTTRRSKRCGKLLDVERHNRHPAHGDVCHAAHGSGSAAGISPTGAPATSRWASLAATRSGTTPRARAGRCKKAERWLSANLGYEPEAAAWAGRTLMTSGAHVHGRRPMVTRS